ncbi:hypothetical protein EYF80_034389 [Liparis tanakae]|uniref:Uncharacterized protein n=1 Tax=Liparis tanakae TaxID=230148 RepID=A0A4Z2GP97_9TELE|nr:hypothetical protein EYF80_034389 [Liparis tanakae]
MHHNIRPALEPLMSFIRYRVVSSRNTTAPQFRRWTEGDTSRISKPRLRIKSRDVDVNRDFPRLLPNENEKSYECW